MLTSNKAFSEWASVFGDEVLATAILDNLHHAHVCQTSGDSFVRLSQALAGQGVTPLT